MQPIRTLIVDDEPLARRGLELRLRELGGIDVIAQSTHGADAVRKIAELRPDLVFLDVQMPEMDGFETLAAIPAGQRPLIVFVTAFDQHAVRAFEACALDYLLKPVDEDRLRQTLARVREALDDRASSQHRERLLELLRQVSGRHELSLDDTLDPLRTAEQLRSRDVLAIRDGQKTVRVRIAQIRYIEAAGDYMCVHTDDGTHVLRSTLRELEKELDPAHFQRVHRSTIVHLDRVRALRSHINGEYFLELDSGHEVKLSRSYRDKVELLR